MNATVILLLFYLLAPLLILYLCNRFSLLNKLGAVVIAYILGFIAGNTGLIHESMQPLQEDLTDITILLAIPLLLFSLNIGRWFKMSGKAFLSLILGLAALIVAIVTGHYLWGGHIQGSWQVAGMLTGVYSGGTPNLAAIKNALGVDESTYILTHTYDIILSTLYLFLLISVGKVVLRRFLPRYISSGNETPDDEQVEFENYRGFFKKSVLVPLLLPLLATVVILVIAFLITKIVPEKIATVLAILTITTCGIIGSLIPLIRKTRKTFETGMYFILIFSIVVASRADFRSFDPSSLYLFIFVGWAVFGTLLLHVLLARIFRIDADTMMISSVALIFSPPFVPMVAGALKNRDIIISGLAVGLIGYALGNYLGVSIALLLQ